MNRWNGSQSWKRDRTTPCLALGAPGAFDDAHIFAPCVADDDGVYRMWYTDVAEDPWSFRYAESRDGCQWNVVSEPVLTLDQPWEHGRLFYPTVLRVDDRHLMWYGSSDLLTSRIYSDTNS